MLAGVHLALPRSDDPASAADRIGDRIERLVERVDECMEDGTLTDLHHLPRRRMLDAVVLVLRDGRPVYWSSNAHDVAGEVDVADIGREPSLDTLRNGIHLVWKRPRIDGVVLVSVPIEHRYEVQNRSLINGLNDALGVGRHWTVTPAGGPGTVHLDGDPVFGIAATSAVGERPNVARIATGGLLVLFLLVAAVLTGLAVRPHAGGAGSAAVMVALFAGIRLLMETSILDFTVGDLFDPRIFASPTFGAGLGTSFLSAMTVLLASIAVVRELRNVRSGRWRGTIALAVTGDLFVWSVLWWRSLVLDSVISFRIESLFRFQPHTILAFLIMLMTAMAVLLVHRAALRVLTGQRADRWVAAGVTAVVMLAHLLWALDDARWIAATLASFGVFHVVSSHAGNASQRGLRSWSIAVVLGGLVFFISTTVWTVQQVRVVRSMEQFALDRLEDRDHVAEFAFDAVEDDLLADRYVANSFRSPLVSLRDLAQRIRYLYISGIFTGYDLRVLPFDEEGRPIKRRGDQTLRDVRAVIDERGLETSADHLIYDREPTGGYRYLAVLPYRDDVGETLGTLVLEIRPGIYGERSVYPELLIEGSVISPMPDRDLDFALYADGRLIRETGRFDHSDRIFFEPPERPGAPMRWRADGWHHLAMRGEDQRVVVVTRRAHSLLDPLSFFTFLLVIGWGMMALLLAVADAAVRMTAAEGLMNWQMTLRARIHLLVSLVLVLSFVVIAGVTIYNLRTQSIAQQADRLRSDQRDIVDQLRAGTDDLAASLPPGQPGTTLASVNLRLSELSDQHGVDINLFDRDGILIGSSQPEIHKRDIIAGLVDPAALETLLAGDEEIIHPERIGELDYLSAYKAILATDGSVAGILHIPYFARERDLRERIDEFVVALVNVYLLLLLLSLLVAFVLSTSITKPLRLIVSGLKSTELGRDNTPIRWERDDEIGVLVREYNHMIRQLDESARRLARTERETAWRGMARQIAHEIKNPLTPMKLSIQQLERAIRQDPDRAEELMARTGRTLVEQIENLDAIASAFSSFARLPEGEREPVDLNDVARNVTALFADRPDIRLRLQTSDHRAVVLADKNHMVSVLNNLVQNAVQAVEEAGQAGHVTVEVDRTDGRVLVHVRDDGIGISDDQMERIFAPNFTTKSSGAGLGLAITKRLVEGVGGTIRVTSRVNEGTVFTVDLPCHDDPH